MLQATTVTVNPMWAAKERKSYLHTYQVVSSKKWDTKSMNKRDWKARLSIGPKFTKVTKIVFRD